LQSDLRRHREHESANCRNAIYLRNRNSNRNRDPNRNLNRNRNWNRDRRHSGKRKRHQIGTKRTNSASPTWSSPHIIRTGRTYCSSSPGKSVHGSSPKRQTYGIRF
jgi:hypothetical protein